MTTLFDTQSTHLRPRFRHQGFAPPGGLSCLLGFAWFAAAVGTVLFSKPIIFTAAGVIDITSPLQRKIQLGASVLILLGVILGLRQLRPALKAASAHPVAYASLLGCIALMTVFSAFRGSLLEVGYLALFVCSLLLGAIIWTSPAKYQRAFATALPIACLTVVVLAIAIYGMPKGRWVGGIHPNIFGFLVVIVAIYGIQMRSIFGLALFVAAFILAMLISSRYSMLSMLIIAALHTVVYLSRRAGGFGAIAISALIALVLAVVATPVLSNLFLLNDASRGVGSGGSGRADITLYSLERIADHFAFGVGFRNREGYIGAHNGYVNFLNENGIFVSTLFAITLCASIISGLHYVFTRSDDASRKNFFAVYVFFAALVSAYFQPQLVNFADSQGCMLIFGLSFIMTRPIKARFAVDAKDCQISASENSAARGLSGYAKT